MQKIQKLNANAGAESDDAEFGVNALADVEETEILMPNRIGENHVCYLRECTHRLTSYFGRDSTEHRIAGARVPEGEVHRSVADGQSPAELGLA